MFASMEEFDLTDPISIFSVRSIKGIRRFDNG